MMVNATMTGKCERKFIQSKISDKLKRFCFCLRCRKVYPLRAILNAKLRAKKSKLSSMDFADNNSQPGLLYLSHLQFGEENGAAERPEYNNINPNSYLGDANSVTKDSQYVDLENWKELTENERIHVSHYATKNSTTRGSVSNSDVPSSAPCATAYSESISCMPLYNSHCCNISRATGLLSDDYLQEWQCSVCCRRKRQLFNGGQSSRNIQYSQPKQSAKIRPDINGFSITKAKNRMVPKRLPKLIHYTQHYNDVHRLQKHEAKSPGDSPLEQIHSQSQRDFKDYALFVGDSSLKSDGAENIPLNCSSNRFACHERNYDQNTIYSIGADMKKNTYYCNGHIGILSEVNMMPLVNPKEKSASYRVMGNQCRKMNDTDLQLRTEAADRYSLGSENLLNGHKMGSRKLAEQHFAAGNDDQRSKDDERSFVNYENTISQETYFEDKEHCGPALEPSRSDDNPAVNIQSQLEQDSSSSTVGVSEPDTHYKDCSPVFKLRLRTYGNSFDNAFVSPEQLKELHKVVISSNPIDCILETRQVDQNQENHDVACQPEMEENSCNQTRKDLNRSAEQDTKVVPNKMSSPRNSITGSKGRLGKYGSASGTRQHGVQNSSIEHEVTSEMGNDIRNESQFQSPEESNEKQNDHEQRNKPKEAISSMSVNKENSECGNGYEEISCPCMQKVRRNYTIHGQKSGFGVKKLDIEDEFDDFAIGQNKRDANDKTRSGGDCQETEDGSSEKNNRSCFNETDQSSNKDIHDTGGICSAADTSPEPCTTGIEERSHKAIDDTNRPVSKRRIVLARVTSKVFKHLEDALSKHRSNATERMAKETEFIAKLDSYEDETAVEAEEKENNTDDNDDDDDRVLQSTRNDSDLSVLKATDQEIAIAGALLSLGQCNATKNDTSESHLLESARTEITEQLYSEVLETCLQTLRTYIATKRSEYEVSYQGKIDQLKRVKYREYDFKLERILNDRKADIQLKTEYEIRIIRQHFLQELWIRIQKCICGTVGQLSCCGACNAAFYCSKRCQFDDRFFHADVCERFFFSSYAFN